jgi:hypothetical protein
MLLNLVPPAKKNLLVYLILYYYYKALQAVFAEYFLGLCIVHNKLKLQVLCTTTLRATKQTWTKQRLCFESL